MFCHSKTFVNGGQYTINNYFSVSEPSPVISPFQTPTSQQGSLITLELQTVSIQNECPQVSNYNVGNTSSLIACDLGELNVGPARPRTIQFPKSTDKLCMGRNFQFSWYDTFSWLEYSVLMNKAYCFAWRYFSTASSKSENAFIHKGLNNCNHAMQKCRGIKGHDNSEDHNISMISGKTLGIYKIKKEFQFWKV